MADRPVREERGKSLIDNRPRVACLAVACGERPSEHRPEADRFEVAPADVHMSDERKALARRRVTTVDRDLVVRLGLDVWRNAGDRGRSELRVGGQTSVELVEELVPIRGRSVLLRR